MSNLFDNLTKGNFGALGDSLKTAMNGGGLGSVGDALKGTLGNAPANAASAAGNAGDALKGALGNVNLGGLGGMLGAGALGGLLGTLLSGKSAGKIAKGALMVGGTAAAGALAWKFYQKWSQNAQISEAPAGAAPTQSIPAQNAPSGWPTGLTSAPQAEPLAAGTAQAALPPAENTAMLLLESMVFAARADGHIDEQEQTNIHNAVQAMFPQQDVAGIVDHLMRKPLDPASLAARVRNHEEGCDIYRLSCMIINIDHFMERSYMDGLAAALRISPEVKTRLEHEAALAKQEAA